jgi:hypothetical protein
MALTNKETIALEEVIEGLDTIREYVLRLQRKLECIEDQGTIHTGLQEFVATDKHNKL